MVEATKEKDPPYYYHSIKQMSPGVQIAKVRRQSLIALGFRVSVGGGAADSVQDESKLTASSGLRH